MNKKRYLLLCTVSFIAVIGFLFGHKILLVLWSLYNSRNYPPYIANQTPIILNLELDICSSVKNQISIYGYSFEVPWTKIEETRSEDFIIIRFDSGIALSILNPNRNISIFEGFRKNDNFEKKAIKILKKEMLHSDFALIEGMLNTTRDDLSIFKAIEDIYKAIILLTMKSIFLPIESETGIYSFEAEAFRGFQTGNPLAHKKVTIYFFDTVDKELNVMISLPEESKITQKEINCIIRSIEKSNVSNISNGADAR